MAQDDLDRFLERVPDDVLVIVDECLRQDKQRRSRTSELLHEFQVAVHDDIRSLKGNYELDSEQWYPRRGLTVKTTEVKLPARFFVPIWRAEPAAIVRKVTTTLTPITES